MNEEQFVEAVTHDMLELFDPGVQEEQEDYTGPPTEEHINDIIDEVKTRFQEGWSVYDTRRYIHCFEELNAVITEKVACDRMARISAKYKKEE